MYGSKLHQPKRNRKLQCLFYRDPEHSNFIAQRPAPAGQTRDSSPVQKHDNTDKVYFSNIIRVLLCVSKQNNSAPKFVKFSVWRTMLKKGPNPYVVHNVICQIT